MPGTTTINALRYATLTDSPNAQTAFQNLAEDVDTRVIPRFASTGARDAAITSPVQGMFCDVTSVGLQRYSGSAWVTYGAAVTTYVITSAPTSRTSTTTLAADPYLTLAVAASSTYNFKIGGPIASGGVTSADFKCQIHVPTGTFMSVNLALGMATGANDSLDANGVFSGEGWDNDGTSGIYSFGIHVNNASFTLEGWFTTASTAGSISLYWAPTSSDAVAVTLRQGASMRIDKLA